MLYVFDDTLKETTVAEAGGARVAAGIIDLDELKANNEILGFPAKWIEECEKPDTRFRSVIEVTDGMMFTLVSVRNVSEARTVCGRVGLFIKSGLLLLVSVLDKGLYIETAFEEAAKCVNPKTVSLERIISRFFERLCIEDSGRMETLENRIAAMEEKIETGRADREINGEILALRKRLLNIRNYFEQLVEVSEALVENNAGIFHSEKLYHFSNMHSRLARLSANAQLLRDSLLQVREAYQAAIQFSENQTMKFFTVVTTIFLPLTLLVGWYGMNFKYMPELTWRYGYLGVAVLAAGICAAAIIIFKRKHLL